MYCIHEANRTGICRNGRDRGMHSSMNSVISALGVFGWLNTSMANLKGSKKKLAAGERGNRSCQTHCCLCARGVHLVVLYL